MSCVVLEESVSVVDESPTAGHSTAMLLLTVHGLLGWSHVLLQVAELGLLVLLDILGVN
jgi:hypothetical protein